MTKGALGTSKRRTALGKCEVGLFTSPGTSDDFRNKFKFKCEKV